MYRDDEFANIEPESDVQFSDKPAENFPIGVNSITNSEKFIRRGVLPEVESAVPIRSVFALLSQRPDSGFVLMQFGHANRYVVGKSLAEAFLAKAKANREGVQQGIADSADTPVGDWIALPSVRSFSVQDIVSSSAEVSSLEKAPEAVFPVGSPNLRVGYFLNHETVRYAAVGRVVWICGNPSNPHENPDPDHGSCGFCPFPIDHTEVR